MVLIAHGTIALEAEYIAGPDKSVVGILKGEYTRVSGYNIPTEGLWVIDKSMYGLEPGKMVVYVLQPTSSYRVTAN